MLILDVQCYYTMMARHCRIHSNACQNFSIPESVFCFILWLVGWLVVLRHGFELKAIFILNLKVGLQPRQNGGPDTELKVVTLVLVLKRPLFLWLSTQGARTSWPTQYHSHYLDFPILLVHILVLQF